MQRTRSTSRLRRGLLVAASGAALLAAPAVSGWGRASASPLACVGASCYGTAVGEKARACADGTGVVQVDAVTDTALPDACVWTPLGVPDPHVPPVPKGIGTIRGL